MKSIQNRIWIMWLSLLVSVLFFCAGCGSDPEKLEDNIVENMITSEEYIITAEENETQSADSQNAGQDNISTNISQDVTEDEAASKDTPEATSKDTSEDSIFVHISGAVKYPGVYEVSADSRLVEAVDLAGGFLEGAAESYCNLAQCLQDGTQYYIPTEKEVQDGFVFQTGAGDTSGQNTADYGFTGQQSNSGKLLYSEDGKLNINLATAEDFQTLTGIGETRANAIVAYREENGDFSSPEDIMKVSGIKEGTYQQFKDQITVIP